MNAVVILRVDLGQVNLNSLHVWLLVVGRLLHLLLAPIWVLLLLIVLIINLLRGKTRDVVSGEQRLVYGHLLTIFNLHLFIFVDLVIGVGTEHEQHYSQEQED